MERALAEAEFTLRYQLKIAQSAEGLKIQGAEALVRWNHPRRGELEPRHFLGAIEAHGFHSSLTDLVIMEAMRTVCCFSLATWRLGAAAEILTAASLTELYVTSILEVSASGRRVFANA